MNLTAVHAKNAAAYPHHPGMLYDCPACESRCFCVAGESECIFDGEHVESWWVVKITSNLGQVSHVITTNAAGKVVTARYDSLRSAESHVTGLRRLSPKATFVARCVNADGATVTPDVTL